MKKIIHKYFLMNGNNPRFLGLEESNLKYLCNRKVKWGDWKRTEINRGNKVTCKNCLKIIKNKILYKKIRIIEEL